MHIQKVLNSSVVLVQDDSGEESILLGKGIGYGRKAGEPIERQPSDRVFLPLSNPDAQPMLELFSSIPASYLELTQDIVDDAEQSLGVKLSAHIYLLLTDHLHFAVERQQKGLVVTNRIFWEIKHFYPKEYAVGQRGLQKVKAKLGIELPDEEAGNIAFHIVNARQDPQAGYDAMRAARLIGELSNIVTYSMHCPVSTESIHYARFVSHLQYFAERFFSGKLMDSEDDFLFQQMQQIAQLFLILIMGYAVVKVGLLKASDSRVLSVVMVYLVTPCVIINAFQIDDTPEIRKGLLYSMAIAAAIHVVLLVLSALLSRPLKLDAVEQVNVIYSNAAALVIPLVKALMGDAYVIYSCAFIIVQLVLLWTHASSLLQGSSALDWKKVLTNINMIAIAAGALLYWFRVVLPAPLQNTMSTVGNMMGPMGMLLAGMAIAEKPLREVFCTRRNYLPTVLRLVVCPLVVLVLLWVCHASSWVADGKNILMTVYLAAITPACATVTSMAQLYDRDAAHSSALYVLTTLLSIVSMPVMIGLFDLLL